MHVLEGFFQIYMSHGNRWLFVISEHWNSLWFHFRSFNKHWPLGTFAFVLGLSKLRLRMLTATEIFAAAVCQFCIQNKSRRLFLLVGLKSFLELSVSLHYFTTYITESIRFVYRESPRRSLYKAKIFTPLQRYQYSLVLSVRSNILYWFSDDWPAAYIEATI